jgi:ferredoxin
MHRADACVRQCRALALRQDCRACVEACPRGAVELDPLRVKLDRCNGCRLCIEACPSGALVDTQSGRHELVAAWGRTQPGVPFVVACDSARQVAADTPALRLTCLTGVGWEVAAIPLLLGASSVELRHGSCGKCPFGARARSSLVRTIEKLGLLAGELRLGEIVEAELPARTPAARRRVSRRGLLGAFLDRPSSQARALLDVETVTEPAPTWLRALTARLISAHPCLARARPLAGLAAQPVIDDGRCTRCGVCRTLCPTGALAEPQQPSTSHVAVIAHRCAGCERCVRGCPERALRLDARVDLRLWAAGRPAQVIAERQAQCRACGDDGVLPGLELCGACRRGALLTARQRA